MKRNGKMRLIPCGHSTVQGRVKLGEDGKTIVDKWVECFNCKKRLNRYKIEVTLIDD